MGYMGFGMRKEDYKRKPKEAFGKLKRYLDVSKPSSIHPSDVSSEKFVRFRYRHFYETRFLKYL